MKLINSKDDQLFLEDESGRILLVQWTGGLASQMVTGVTVAVKGQVLEGGEFKVCMYPILNLNTFSFHTLLSFACLLLTGRRLLFSELTPYNSFLCCLSVSHWFLKIHPVGLWSRVWIHSDWGRNWRSSTSWSVSSDVGWFCRGAYWGRLCTTSSL